MVQAFTFFLENRGLHQILIFRHEPHQMLQSRYLETIAAFSTCCKTDFGNYK